MGVRLAPLAGLLAVQLAAIDSRAQTCTLGPYCGDSPGSCGASTPLSTVSTNINAAPDGAVVCLTRGQTWFATGGLDLTASHPDSNRVTICSSDSTQCTTSGKPAALIKVTADTKNVNGNTGCGVRTSGGAGGYTFRNIAWKGPTIVLIGSANSGLCLDKGSHDLTFEGGKLDTFTGFAWLSDGSGANVTNVKLGTCASRMEWTGDQSQSAVSDRIGTFGSLDNSSISVWVHNWHVMRDKDHLIDLVPNGCSDWTTAASSHNVTIECSVFDHLSSSFTIVKAASGHGLTFRDNTFLGCGQSGLAFGSHGPDGNCYGWDGAEVYRNKFDFTCPDSAPITNGIGKNIHIFNNIARLSNGTDALGNQDGFVRFHCDDGNACDQPMVTMTINNNTIYRYGNQGGVGFGRGIITDNPADCGICRTPQTDVKLFNNLVIDTSSQEALFVENDKGVCDDYQTNGAGIHDNFGWAPSTSTVNVLEQNGVPLVCSGSDGWKKSGSNPSTVDNYTLSPGLTDYVNFDFRVSPSSPVCGLGDAANQPATDFAGNTRTANCIGAYDVP